MGFVWMGKDRQKWCVLLVENISWFATATRSDRWLVGVSGGADSVALLHLLVAAGFSNLIVCHLDHRLRGRVSTEDAEFVRRLAGELGVECEIFSADVRGRMTKCGESLETAARHERHAFFAKCSVKFSCPRILLAHHADDQAETVLWNLLRGSHGLKGMLAEQILVTESGVRLELCRPLLGVRHSALISWLESCGYRWREDASNAEPIAIRNRLRNEALPLLDAISNRDTVQALVRGAEETEDAAALETWALDQVTVLDPQGRLHLPTMRRLPVALQRVAIRKFLTDQGIPSPDRGTVDRALELLDVSNPAVMNLPGGRWLRRRAGRLLVD
jgi:tRNA(Ile)-lysidine synthase